MNKWTETEDQTLSDTSLSYDQLQALLPGQEKVYGLGQQNLDLKEIPH